MPKRTLTVTKYLFMREPERDLGRLQDIIQAAKHIASFTEGYSQEELMSEKLRYFAVIKNVEIIGEAGEAPRNTLG